jgi:predicted RNA-binding Zn ribbon-like protein
MTPRPQAAEVHASTDVDHLGGHVALNFLNTSRMHNGALIDTLQTDKDVRSWMQSMQLPEPLLQKPLPDGAVLIAARHVRDVFREAVRLRKAGKRLAPDQLNRLLEMSKSHLVLKQAKDELELTRRYTASNPEEFLAPLTDTIADLLVTGNFDLIRQCEGDVCVLWFLDTTKGHQRRWCSADSCGTRARVAAFRARQAATARKKK